MPHQGQAKAITSRAFENFGEPSVIRLIPAEVWESTPERLRPTAIPDETGRFRFVILRSAAGMPPAAP